MYLKCDPYELFHQNTEGLNKILSQKAEILQVL